MYNVTNHALRSLLLPIVLSLFLVACGGATGGDAPPPTTNKPEGSSSQPVQVTSSSSKQIDSNATSTSSLASSPTPASSAINSSSNYHRASRSSTNTSEDGIPESTEDITPPGVTKLFLQSAAETSITLIWGHAADDTGVYRYQIERNEKPIAILEFPTYTYSDTNLTPLTYYTYTIQAIDFNGNVSDKSTDLTIRTLAATDSSTASSSQQSSKASTSSKSSSSSSIINSVSSSKISSSKSSTTSSRTSSSASGLPKTVQLRWRHPTQRANGSYLELDDIGGYELRKKTSISISYIKIAGNSTTNYTLNDIAADDQIDIAVYDTNGFFSDFIQIYPR